jgi:transcriptional antiterminator NusG
MPKRWYVIHTKTGYEDKVKASLENLIKQDHKEELIANILIPTEKVSEVKSGRKRILQRKFFPGYVLVEMELTDETWYMIKNNPGVSGFIKSGSQPVPLRQEEVDAILKQAESAQEKPMPKVVFECGEGIRVTNGPFMNFTGTIEEIYPSKGKLKAVISIFGRATPVELEYWQVEKL